MKNKQALALLLSANIISGFAQGISMLSIPWYFTSIINEGSTFGMVYGIVTFATIFWSLYAGTLIDKYSRKKIFLCISLVGGIVLSIVSLIGFWQGELSLFLILFVFTITIFIFNIHYPALYAFAQEISEKENYGKMNSYLEIQGQATTVFAGAIGAILLTGTTNQTFNLIGFNISLPFDIERWELHQIFLMDAATYFIAFVLIWLIKYQPQQQLAKHLGTISERVRMGFSYLRQNPLIFLFGNMSRSIFVILLVEVHLLLPWYVNNHLNQGADVYASSEIYYAFGALLAGISIRELSKKLNTIKSVIILMIVTVFGLLLCTITKSVAVFYVFSILIGITNAGSRVLTSTYLFAYIPNNMMGRAGSVFQMINILLRSVFIALFSLPFFAAGSNVIWAYFIGALFIAACVVPLIMNYKKLVILKA